MFGAFSIYRGHAGAVWVVSSAYYGANRQPNWGEFVREGGSDGRGTVGLTPPVYRREGVCEGRVRVDRVEGPSGMKER